DRGIARRAEIARRGRAGARRRWSRAAALFRHRAENSSAHRRPQCRSNQRASRQNRCRHRRVDRRMNYFVTGTDTDVGKTFVSNLLIRGLRAAGLDTVGMKPICCGGREDAELLHAACDFSIPLNDVNPIWVRTPAAPYTACVIENRLIDLDAIRETFARVRREHRWLIIEGAGGWLVPITREFFVSDLAAEMKLPIVVVANNKLGAINHTLLT